MLIKGVPTLAKEDKGWRVEFGKNGFNIKMYEDDPIVTVDEENKTATFTLVRDTYTPIAVLKAFMKIGLTLLPHDEIQHFPGLLAWVKDPNHRAGIVRVPILYTFQPGPMPNDKVAAGILIRKSANVALPYAFLILAYGNEMFQVPLPSEMDKLGAGTNTQFTLHHFPYPPSLGLVEKYGEPRRSQLKLFGIAPVKGEVQKMIMGFDELRPGPAVKSPST